MIRHKVAIGLLIAMYALPSSLGAAEQYLCVTEQASGFQYDAPRKAWRHASFNVDRKYIVALSREPGYAYQVTMLGKTSPLGLCQEDFDAVGLLSCNVFMGHFKFNKHSGRFIYSYVYGYYNITPNNTSDETEGDDTPNLQIGRCSPF